MKNIFVSKNILYFLSPDRSLDVVPGDHEGDDVSGVELGDGAVCLLLDEVLHDDQAQEVSSLLQLRPRQLVYLGELHPVLRNMIINVMKMPRTVLFLVCFQSSTKLLMSQVSGTGRCHEADMVAGSIVVNIKIIES